MTTYAMGVDFGSTTAKTIILNGAGEIVAARIESMGAVSDEGVKASIAGALHEAGIAQDDVDFCVTTGYGRRMLDVSQKSYTEITCHARGAVALVPEARLVIDIGGQDSKVIAVDSNGLVETFAMNDRCAAGTGKFLEVLARAVEIKLPEMGPLAMQATQTLKISSMCATFAETEVISLLAEGHAKPDVLGAVHAAIAARTAGLVGRVGKRTPIVMTGGVAKNIAAVHHIEATLGQKLVLPPDPQIAGALGAALFALDEIRLAAAKKLRSGAADEEDRVVDVGMDGARACSPACKGTAGSADSAQAREFVVAPPKLRATVS
jgi:(R)-2-hydroxyacyl-CoA dehydratese activating ATPase